MFTPRIKKEKKPELCSCGKALNKRSMTDKCKGCLDLLEFQLINDSNKLSPQKA